MSSKRDWNEMSDDDSEQQRQVHQELHSEQQKQQPQSLPSLNKIVSSPFPEKKSSANQQENLKKLQSCKRQDIWLYVPLFYKDNVEDIDQLLRKYENVKKIQKFSKGWNILTRRQDARGYIVEGKKQGKFFIKFYFSNKNDDTEQKNSSYQNSEYSNRNRENYDNKKVKYVPKSPNSKADIKDMRSPDHLRRVESMRENETSYRTPKSPTYKNQQWKNFSNSNTDYRKNRERNERGDSQEEDRNKDNTRNYKQKYTTKNSQQYKIQTPKAEKQYNPDSPTRKKYVLKAQQGQPKSEIIKPIVQKTEQVQKVEEPESSPKVVEQVEEADTQAEKKAKKKKTKKNQFSNDNNNPFSMLNHL